MSDDNNRSRSHAGVLPAACFFKSPLGNPESELFRQIFDSCGVDPVTPQSATSRDAMQILPIEVTQHQSGAVSVVSGFLIRNFDRKLIREVEREWEPIRRVLEGKLATLGRDLEHGHWDWQLKIQSDELHELQLTAVEVEGVVQALMATQTGQSRLAPHAGLELIRIEYLESAPWNNKFLRKCRPLFLARNCARPGSDP